MQIGGALRPATPKHFSSTFSGAASRTTGMSVERFRSSADGEISPVPIAAPAARGKKRRRTRHTVTSLSNVKKMRPARDEVIVCTAVNLEDSGVQFWGVYAVWGHMLRQR